MAELTHLADALAEIVAEISDIIGRRAVMPVTRDLIEKLSRGDMLIDRRYQMEDGFNPGKSASRIRQAGSHWIVEVSGSNDLGRVWYELCRIEGGDLFTPSGDAAYRACSEKLSEYFKPKG